MKQYIKDVKETHFFMCDDLSFSNLSFKLLQKRSTDHVSLMYCFGGGGGGGGGGGISYNSLRNVSMCVSEVAMCEKCRSNLFQSEGEYNV